MPVPKTPPLVIPRQRTVVIGGQAEAVQILPVEIQQQGRADILWMMRAIAAIDTGQQVELNNPPEEIIVDGRAARNFDDAQRNIVVFFGTKLARTAMRAVEHELRGAITRATTAHSNRLSSVESTWRWRLVMPDGSWTTVTSSTDLPAFTRGMLLILEPLRVPYATVANRRARGGGKLSRTVRERRKRGMVGPLRVRQETMGFLGAAARALRGRPEFRQFAVKAVFTRRFTVPGELSRKQGTGEIVISFKAPTGGGFRRR